MVVTRRRRSRRLEQSSSSASSEGEEEHHQVRVEAEFEAEEEEELEVSSSSESEADDDGSLVDDNSSDDDDEEVEVDFGSPSPRLLTPRRGFAPGTPRRQLHRTPPHLRLNRHVKTGYVLHQKKDECFATWWVWNNQTGGAYASALGVVVMCVFMLNMSVASLELGADVFDSTGMVWAAVIVVVHQLVHCVFHTYCTLPEVYPTVHAAVVATQSMPYMALAFALWQYGFPPFPPALECPEITWSFHWYAAIATMAYVSGFVYSTMISKASTADVPTLVHLVHHAVGLFVLLNYVFLLEATVRVKLGVVMLVIGMVLAHLHIPERLAPRVFDLVGNSVQIWHLARLFAFYLFLTDIFVKKSGGQSNLLWDSALFC